MSVCLWSLLQNRELQIMRKLDHCNIVRLRYFFYSSGEKVRTTGRGGTAGANEAPDRSCETDRGVLFFPFSSQKDEVYLNLVLDFVPETVYRVARHFNKAKSIIPIIYVKVGSLRSASGVHHYQCVIYIH